MGLFRCHLPVELQVRLRPNKKQNGLLMRILACLPDPAIQAGEAFLVIDAKSEEDAADALVEGAHDGPEGFLSGLARQLLTVSQICSLTCVLSSILTVLEVNSTPTVTLY